MRSIKVVQTERNAKGKTKFFTSGGVEVAPSCVMMTISALMTAPGTLETAPGELMTAAGRLMMVSSTPEMTAGWHGAHL